MIEEINAQQTLSLEQGEFRRLIDKTHFSMAQQDVRYYLNGLLLETDGKTLRAVATDGHRLAICEMTLKDGGMGTQHQVIVPRKGVWNCSGFWGLTAPSSWRSAPITFGPRSGKFASHRKLIDGRFPDTGRSRHSREPG